MNYHKSIDTLPIANYTRIVKTNNLGYLFDCSFLQCETMQVTPELLKVWENIRMEYSEFVSKRPDSNILLDKQYEMYQLECDLLKVKLICRQLILGDIQEQYFDYLEDLGYNIDKKGNIQEQAIEINRRSDNYISQITAIEQEIEMLRKSGKEVSLEDMVVLINRHMKINIDIYTTTTKQWLTYENKAINEINKKSKK